MLRIKKISMPPIVRTMVRFVANRSLHLKRTSENRITDPEKRMAGLHRKLMVPVMYPTMAFMKFYRGPEMPPSFLTLQKWMAINTAATRGMKMQCNKT